MTILIGKNSLIILLCKQDHKYRTSTAYIHSDLVYQLSWEYTNRLYIPAAPSVDEVYPCVEIRQEAPTTRYNCTCCSDSVFNHACVNVVC